jgi:hypothetical protein
LIPSRVSKGNLVTEGLQSLGFFLFVGNLLLGSLDGLGCGSRRHRCRIGRRFRFGSIGLGVKRADQELVLVFLQDSLVVVLPELLGSVLASDALEDLFAA